jgi:hypothetical protein
MMRLQKVLAAGWSGSIATSFFVDGAYQAKELRSNPRQRLRLLAELFENVTPN